MNIGLIGARRTNNGIGEYIARYFHAAGAQVSAVLGTSDQTARSAAENLVKYGIRARPYSDFSRMINDEDIDAVVIASRAATHEHYIEQSIEAGAHVFVEKPFLPPDTPDLPRVLKKLFIRARRRRITIAMNSQWGFSLPFYEELCGQVAQAGAGTFIMRLSPMCSGREMIPDSVPHALSMLHTALGEGVVEDVEIRAENDSMDISFAYRWSEGVCRASVNLVTEKKQPRTFSFGFGGRVAHRTIDMATYGISLSYEGKVLPIPDPLRLSVGDFVSAIEDRRAPSVGEAHITATTRLLRNIYDAYAFQ